MGLKPHYIRHNRINSIPQNIIFYDTETYETANNGIRMAKLRLGWARYIRLDSIRVKHDEWFRFNSPSEFWDFVESKARRKTRLWLISHNQHFDFNVTNGFRELAKRGWELRKFVIDSDIFILHYTKNDSRLAVIDTLNYIKAKLEDMGKQIGLEKLKVDFNNVSDEELSKYCMRDVEILSTWFINFLKWWKCHDLGKFGETVSQLAFNAYRHAFMNYKLLVHNNQDAIRLELDSYRGGRNECFRLGEYRGEFYKLDVNSMYPFVMAYNYYPTKLIRYTKNLTVKQLRDYIDYYNVIARVKVEIDEPAIALKREKLIFPVGRFTVTLTTPELHYAFKYGKILDVYEAAIYKGEMIFSAYVKYFYDMKLEAEKKSDKLTRQFAKLLMNSLYGKFAQRVREYKPIEQPAPVDYGTEIFTDAKTKERYTVIYINGKAYLLEKTETLFRDAMVSVSSHVTAYARMYLWELIKRAGRENVYYTDTDSLIVNKDGYERLKYYIGDELGMLKLEGVADRLVINAPKDYVFGDEVKKKGIRQTDKQVDERTYIHETYAKTKTQIRKGYPDGLIIRQIVKRLNYNYDKGIVLPDGRVEPFKIYED